jgi:acyl-CoA synthetase (AMP-forming)/AMP-acid ligase II
MGNKIVIMKKFDPEIMLSLIQAEKVTLCSIVPTICKRLLEVSPEKHFDTKSWRYCTGTGSAWTFDMKKQLMEKYPNTMIADAYGATEVFSGTLLKGREIINKPGSVGRPYLDTSIRIIDEEGNEVKPYKIGEIVLFGPHATLGYYKEPEATEKALKDGWFHTGDLGYIDEEGFLFLADRATDMIISGGENIYSAEIESVLLKHEKITEAAVIGVPDYEWGEVVKACIVVSDDAEMSEDEVIEYCKEHLAPYKKPKYVEFYDTLPKNELGKVLKKYLKG